jgi:hypothetical protein
MKINGCTNGTRRNSIKNLGHLSVSYQVSKLSEKIQKYRAKIKLRRMKKVYKMKI